MSITLKSITRETRVRPPRMVILGTPKIGKSTFASGAPNPIFFPIRLEEGIDSLDVPKFPVIKTFDELMQGLTVLAEEDHNFETAVFDSASALEAVIWQSVCKDCNVSSIELAGSGYGKGYGFALDKWQRIMKACDFLREEKNMATIFIGHVKIKRFDDPERASYDQYQFDINDKASAALYRWADFIGFASKNVDVNVEDQGFSKKKIKAVDLDAGQHYLFTKQTPAHPGGGRDYYGQLPAEIPLDWKSFSDAVAEVIAESKKTSKKK